MTAVFAALVPVFLLIAAGMLARRFIVTAEADWNGIERLVYFLLFPALLIDTLWLADLTKVPVVEVAGALVGAVLLMTGLCLALRPAIAARLAIDGPAFTSIFQGATRWQTFVALAVAGNLYGDYGLALASVAAVTMIPLLNVINVWVLARYAAPERPKWREVGIAIARNPLIWSCLVGIALNIAHVPAPASLHLFAASLGHASLALGLLLIGAGLKIRGLVRPAPAALVAVGLKLVVMPLIAVALARVLGTIGVPLAVVVCCAAVPAAPTAYVLARQMGGDTELMAEILTLQMLAAVVTMPLAIEWAAK